MQFPDRDSKLAVGSARRAVAGRMEKITQIEHLLFRSRRLRWVLIGLTLVILATTILLASLQLRTGIREQIASRAGDTVLRARVTDVLTCCNASSRLIFNLC